MTNCIEEIECLSIQNNSLCKFHVQDSPKFYLLDFKYQLNTINIDLMSVSIKEAENASSEFLQMFQDKINKNTVIYTDGSRAGSEAGWSVGMANWCCNDFFKARFKLFDITSIYSAQAIALLMTIKRISSSVLNDLLIFSGSKSVLSSLLNMKKLKHQSYLIQEINQLLFECKEKNKNIELAWIPAHNIEGNDNADELAKKPAVEGPLLEVEVLHSDLVCIFRDKCIKDNDKFLNHRASSFNKGTFYFKN
ncbi:hypothetical protein ALC57_08971 [Trachymyrmex cornetzi]|uniref:RNase H type-1 domain-containing protein n=1 Tax=Trachymyrmex cornetzi TaxID=471704 RepID=A0A151J658_9HYME|nr:hypothetical protein ALC57_08971 [Trachymyrmex cornetzi]